MGEIRARIARWICPELFARLSAAYERSLNYAKKLAEAEKLVLEQTNKIRLLEQQIDLMRSEAQRKATTKARTAAEVRRTIEQQNEREFEESIKNGI